ncbi:hypothetical protein [uncultured Roseobacter sp.]|uniref:spike base protein, RCAP_Rcc01079 family n=1 Tax=uncultured Roseobacter sp. TaxID=114847 RepID=UPI002637C21F|nr:hypothetical protein [uncultured Roseobacter sp.]
MLDYFLSFAKGLTSPADIIESVTPNDVADLQRATRAINVATTGVVRVTTTAGVTDEVTIAAGIAFPIRATRVWATGTTATGIKGLS